MAENQEELSADETAELDELLDGDGEVDKKTATGLKKLKIEFLLKISVK